MRDRRGFEAEVERLREAELGLPPPKETIFRGKTKKPRPKGGPPGQMGKVTPSATGLYQPPEDESGSGTQAAPKK